MDGGCMQDEFEVQLRRLVIGMADQEIKVGHSFLYDGQKLYADDVAEIALPSILCIAQDLSARLGLGGVGFDFSLGPVNPVFPLHAKRNESDVRFFQVSPFVMEVFQGEVMDCRHDFAKLFEVAARLIQPNYDLETNTNYKAAVVANNAEVASPSPTFGG